MSCERCHCGHGYGQHCYCYCYCSCPEPRKEPDKKPKEVILKVGMTCNKCQCAVMKALQSLEGVESVEIDMKKEMVKIRGSAKEDECIKKIKKLGKTVQKWKEDGPKKCECVGNKCEDKTPEIIMVYQPSYPPFNPCYSYCSGPCYCHAGGQGCAIM